MLHLLVQMITMWILWLRSHQFTQKCRNLCSTIVHINVVKFHIHLVECYLWSKVKIWQKFEITSNLMNLLGYLEFFVIFCTTIWNWSLKVNGFRISIWCHLFLCKMNWYVQGITVNNGIEKKSSEHEQRPPTLMSSQNRNRNHNTLKYVPSILNIRRPQISYSFSIQIFFRAIKFIRNHKNSANRVGVVEAKLYRFTAR